MNEILKRMKEISAELDKEGADVEALSKEFAELEGRKAQLEKKEHIRKVAGDAVEYDSFEKTNKDERVFDASSKEYCNAYLKNLAIDKNGNKMFGELTESEKRAFTFTTANTSEVVPTIILDRIKGLVSVTAPLYNDATKGGMAQAFDVVRHTTIEAGDADETAEGVANDDEKDTFDVVSLVGVEIKKHAVVTRKMRFQSISAFEDWLVQHIAARILNAKDKIILARLNNATTGIAAGNVITGTYADATIRRAFALIKSNGLKFVYANNKTIYNGLAGIEDGSGSKAFIPSAMEDAITQGRLYGAGVKLDENIPDDVAYIGVPADILANDFDNYEFMRDVDAKTWQEVFSGYSLFDAALENPYAFVKVTFTSEASEDKGDGE
jgi:HK97 family phage major capsid protein